MKLYLLTSNICYDSEIVVGGDIFKSKEEAERAMNRMYRVERKVLIDSFSKDEIRESKRDGFRCAFIDGLYGEYHAEFTISEKEIQL